MAYQPKSYRKFVATAATATLVATAFAPFASAHSFKDVEKKYDEAVDFLVSKGVTGYTDGTFKTQKTITRLEAAEMLGKALGLTEVKDAPASGFTDVPARVATLINAFKAKGITAGKTATTFGANDNITRGELAIWIQKAYDLKAKEGSSNKFGDVAERYKVAVQALVDNEITQGTTETTFGTTANAKRGDYALFIKRAVDASTTDVASVKAINATTVEVTYKENVTVSDVNASKYTIDGLTVSNAAIKQTDTKTVVLTTSAQEGGKTYTVKNNGTSVGTFKGVSAVIPTAVNVTTSSLQGVIGQEVTLKAQVTVKEGDSKAGVPVTFNIVNGNSNNKTIEVEATTNADGVATYSYTRYYSSEDNVAAYATSKSSVISHGKVYWANSIQLAVSEITAGNELANETKKSYKVTGSANTTYYVAIKENHNVAPNNITDVKVQNHGTQNFVTPYELTTGAKNYATVTTNANGEGSFTIYGTNLSATPIVYSPKSVSSSASYSKLALQAEAPTVKFSQVDRLAIAVVGEGTADSAQYHTTPVAYNQNSAGGRTYTVTVTDKDGKVAPAGTVAYVSFNDMSGDVYYQTGTNKFEKVNTKTIRSLVVGKDGKVQFRVAGSGATTYVKPTVFLNTAGSVTDVTLDAGDIKATAEVTYFKSPVVTNATLSVEDQYGRPITSTSANQDAYFTYQSVDQNGFAYRPGSYTLTPGTTIVIYEQEIDPVTGKVTFVPKEITIGGTTLDSYLLAFDVTSTFGTAEVKDVNGTLLDAVQNLGRTKTYQVKSNADGKAVVRVTSKTADTVSVNVTGASNILPTQTASVVFVNSKELPALYTGWVTGYYPIAETILIDSYNAVSFANSLFVNVNGIPLSKKAFVELLGTHDVRVTATKNADGVYNFSIIESKLKVVVDKAELTTAITKAETVLVDADKYTEASVKALKEAIALAKTVATDVKATNAEVQAATKAVEDAVKALEKIEQDSIKITATASASELGFGLSLYNIEGTIAGKDSEQVDKVQIVFADGAKPSEATYVSTTGKFTFAKSQVSSDSIKVIALDKDGKELKAVTVEVK